MAATITEGRWKGLYTNASPHDIPPGTAVVMDNLQTVRHGELQPRQGIVPWPGQTSADSEAVIDMTSFLSSTGATVLVYQRADGTIKTMAPATGTTTTICSTLSSSTPISLAADLTGYLYGFNGTDSPIRWDGVTTDTAGVAGITPTSVAPTVTLGSGGNLSVGDYQWAYRWTDALGFTSTLSPATTETATANQAATVVCNCSGQTRITEVELWRSTVQEQTTFYYVDKKTNTGSTVSFTDTKSDDDLLTAAFNNIALSLPIYNTDGSPNARRQIPPPSDKLFAAVFQGRLFLYGTSSTTRTKLRQLYWSEIDSFEYMPPTNVAGVLNNTGDNDAETGIMPLGAFIYLLHERHIFQATFISQGTLIVTVQLQSYRGCINNRCWVVAYGTAYLIDQFGAYSFDGQSPQPISESIQDYWYGGVLDFTTSSTWFASFEPNERVVRFHVKFQGSSEWRALCYCPFTQAWWTESYPMSLTAACPLTYQGLSRLAFGGLKDTIYLGAQGLTDYVSTAIVGTVTSATTTTLTDSSANFAATAVAGAPVFTISGTSKGTEGLIVSATTTTLTVASWSAGTPAVGDSYAVGAIQYDFMTGRRQFIDSKDQAVMRNGRLAYLSTQNPATLDLRRFVGNQMAPLVWRKTMQRPNGITYDDDGPSATLNLYVNQFPTTSWVTAYDPGYRRIDFHASFGDYELAPRWIAIELTGFQTLDRITLYTLDIEGVQP